MASIKILMDNGANINIKNKEGFNVFDVLNQEKKYWSQVAYAFTPEEKQEAILIKKLKNETITAMSEYIKNYVLYEQ